MIFLPNIQYPFLPRSRTEQNYRHRKQQIAVCQRKCSKAFRGNHMWDPVFSHTILNPMKILSDNGRNFNSVATIGSAQ